MDISSSIIELHTMLMPYSDTPRTISKKAWEKAAERCFAVIVGMYLSSSINAEQIKAMLGKNESLTPPAKEEGLG